MSEENSPTPNRPPFDPAPSELPQGSSYGALTALIIIALVILAGAFYFLHERFEREGTDIDLEVQFEAASQQMNEELRTIETQSDSTTLTTIEADLAASDMSDLDAELSAIEREFEAVQ